MDWRYFYEKNGVGYSSSGLACRIFARYLRSISNYDEFLTLESMTKLEKLGRNPLTMCFYAERMIFGPLAVRGYTFDAAGIFENLQPKPKQKKQPTTSRGPSPSVLYLLYDKSRAGYHTYQYSISKQLMPCWSTSKISPRVWSRNLRLQ